MCFQFFFTKTLLLYLTKRESGNALTETNEYDAIFTALKHPIRRQILLLLEQKGEASFMDIQNAVGITDTGLMSYHLKELAPLVEQSARGKYRLSEIGQTSIALFRRVEREKQGTSKAVRREVERWAGIVVFLFLIVGVALMAPLTVGIYTSAENLIATSDLPLGFMVGMYLAGLSGMVLGIILFVFYDRHYFTKNIKTNAIHSLIFAAGISLLLIPSAYLTYSFEMATLSLASPSRAGTGLLFMILLAVSSLASAPPVAYGIGRLAKRH